MAADTMKLTADDVQTLAARAIFGTDQPASRSWATWFHTRVVDTFHTA